MTAEVHHGDALELVPDLGEFDVVMTDPPYGIGGTSGLRDPKGSGAAQKMIDGMCHAVGAGVLRGVRRRNGTQAAFLITSWRNISFYAAAARGAGLEPQSGIVWLKNGAGLSAYFHRRHEMVLYAATPGFRPAPKATFLGHDFMCIEVDRVNTRTRLHVYDKPPELAERLLKGFAPGRILDPFCGTGGLLVGAQRLGWDVVGIDISGEFVEKARARLGEGMGVPARANGQESLFAAAGG